jgi:hypothetical protein
MIAGTSTAAAIPGDGNTQLIMMTIALDSGRVTNRPRIEGTNIKSDVPAAGVRRR